MEQDKIGSIFALKYKGRNFMTPTVTGYGSRQAGRYLYEISQGRGFKGERIYGVTVLERQNDDNYESNHDLSQCCHSKEEVRDVLASLNLGE